jgi:hypothetical protein
MANCRTRTTRRKTDAYAVYDALPPPIRAALQEGPQEWDAVNVRLRLRQAAKRMPMTEAIKRVVALLNAAHANEIAEARPWQAHVRVTKGNRVPSPHMLAGATMQTSGRDVR